MIERHGKPEKNKKKKAKDDNKIGGCGFKCVTEK